MMDSLVQEGMVSSPDSYEMRKRFARILLPLRAIFWGGLLCVFDFNLLLGGQRFQVDTLNHAVGMVLIAGGVSVLAAQKVDSRYDWLMSSSAAIAGALTVGAFTKLLRPDWLIQIQVLVPLFRILGLAATIAFTLAMKRLAVVAAAPTLEQSWRVTAEL